jgi:hypothetical protein
VSPIAHPVSPTTVPPTSPLRPLLQQHTSLLSSLAIAHNYPAKQNDNTHHHTSGPCPQRPYPARSSNRQTARSSTRSGIKGNSITKLLTFTRDDAVESKRRRCIKIHQRRRPARTQKISRKFEPQHGRMYRMSIRKDKETRARTNMWTGHSIQQYPAAAASRHGGWTDRR